MKKKKKLKQGIAVSRWLKQSLRLIEGISPELGMRVAAHIFFQNPSSLNYPKKNEKPWYIATKHGLLFQKSTKPLCALNGKTKVKRYCWSTDGAAGAHNSMLSQKAYTKKGCHVISFDAPAHGKSTGKITNMLQWGAAIKALNNHYDEFDVYIGHSLGSMAILKYCEQASNA